MIFFDFIESVLSSIGNFFNFIVDTIGGNIIWFSNAYPCLFRVIIMPFCLCVAFVPFVIASFATFGSKG